jgi:hypothetical protein
MTTPQETMKAKLETLGIPSREIAVYGSQIVITCACEKTAIKWGRVLAKFATVRRAGLKSEEYLAADAKLPNARRMVDVWKTYATV